MALFKLTVEVPLFLVYFSIMLLSAVMMNLYIYKTCYVLLDYPEENCSRLGRYKDNDTQILETKVQPYATYVITITEMIPNSASVFIALIVGSWSDKYGRKPAILFVLSCTTLSMTIISVILLFNRSSPYMILVGSIPTILSGGVTIIFSLCLAYLNDISTSQTRALRMAGFEVLSIFCTCFGTLLSTPFLYATSYATMFGFTSLIIGIGTIYTYFFIPESLQNKSNEGATWASVFTCDHITKLFRVAFRKRSHYTRPIILIFLAVFVLLGFVSGDTNVKTLYLRKELMWSLSDNNIFISLSSVIIMIGTITLTLFLQKKLNIGETLLIIMGIGGQAASIILYAFARNNWYIYGTVPFATLGGLATPMLRTKLGSLIAAEEMGKIFSLICVCNSLDKLISSFTYSYVYNKTLNFKPEGFCWLSLGVTECAMILVGVVIFMESRPRESPHVSDSLLEADNERRSLL